MGQAGEGSGAAVLSDPTLSHQYGLYEICAHPANFITGEGSIVKVFYAKSSNIGAPLISF